MDRRFIFAVRDRQTDAILFLGRVVDPSASSIPRRRRDALEIATAVSYAGSTSSGRVAMRILAIERSVEGDGDTPPVAVEAARAEARAVWELNQAGIVREIYFHADVPSAVLVLECENAAAASEIVAGLPLVKMGAIEFEIVPLRAYPGFARLFAEMD